LLEEGANHFCHREKVESSFESGETLRQLVGMEKPPKRQNVLDVPIWFYVSPFEIPDDALLVILSRRFDF
jgi:hypothetical protein